MMGRRSSLWTELRRERKRRQWEARQEHRAHEQLIRQAATGIAVPVLADLPPLS